MNCEFVQSHFLDFENGSLPEAEANAIRDHLKSCPACQREWSGLKRTLLALDRLPQEAPSPRLRQQFYAMLDAHAEGAESRSPFGISRTRLDRLIERIWPRRPLWQLGAALATLTIGIFVGARGLAPDASSEQSQQLAATQRELAELRSKIDSVDRLVAHSLASQQPAQSRLRQIVSAYEKDGGSEQALTQLLTTLAFDPSTNVRLTALEALYAHAEQKPVRQGVLAALGRETSPLVQVAMIDFLVAAREAEAAPVFQQLARLPNGDQSVRDAAQRALALL
jgi:hypothetical protein